MSVINDMLRDLEQRKAPDRSELDTVPSNDSLIETQSPSVKKYLISLAVLLLAVGVGVSSVLLPEQELPIQETVDQTSLAKDDSTETKIAPITDQPADKKTVHNEALPKVLEKKQSVAVRPEFKKSVTTDQPKPLVSKQKPITKKAPVAVVQQSDVVKKKLLKTMPVSKPISTDSSSTKTTMQSAKPKTLSKTITDKPMVRRKSAVSPQKRDQNMAELSRKLFNAEESKKAYRLLYEFIANYKIDQESRTVLISYLLQDERIAEAGDVIVTTQIDQSPELRQLKARWYVAQGEHNLALHALRSNLPELDGYPEYYALLAAYYQRFGFSEKAAETYASLLEYDNESANWWAGLAIALDSSKQYKEAVSAYKQALEIPDLSPELFEYIENRLSLLTAAASR